MDELEAKRKERRQLRASSGPLLEERDTLVLADQANVEDEAPAEDEAEEDDERPDLLLRESARIVADMAELEADRQLLATQFSQLTGRGEGAKIN